jgi:hypothetical protein
MWQARRKLRHPWIWVVACNLLLPIGLLGSVLPSTQPTSIAENARTQRGQELRQVLLDALDQSYQNNGVWPEQLPAGGNHLVYIKPPNSVLKQDSGSVSRSMSKAPVTVVAYERFDEHPDGVWVGYADAHIEFVATAQGLKDCQSQLPMVAQQPAEPATQPAPTGGQLTLRIIDQEGMPIAGAKVGTYLNLGFKGRKIAAPRFPGEDPQHRFISDNDGNVTIAATSAFDAKFTDQPVVPVYVWQQQRKLIAAIDLSRADFEQKQVREVRLAPACDVHGELGSVGLTAAGDIRSSASGGRLWDGSVWDELLRSLSLLPYQPGAERHTFSA